MDYKIKFMPRKSKISWGKKPTKPTKQNNTKKPKPRGNFFPNRKLYFG